MSTPKDLDRMLKALAEDRGLPGVGVTKGYEYGCNVLDAINAGIANYKGVH